MIVMSNVGSAIFAVGVSFAITSQLLLPVFERPLWKLETELADWLVETSLEQHAQHFFDHGVTNLHGAVEVPPLADQHLQEYLLKHLIQLQQHLLLQHYLKTRTLTEYHQNRLQQAAVRGLQEAADLLANDQDHPILLSDVSLASLSEELWQELAVAHRLPSAQSSEQRGRALFSVALVCCLGVPVLLCTGAVLLFLLGVVRDPAHHQDTDCTCYRQYENWRRAPIQSNFINTDTTTTTAAAGGDVSSSSGGDSTSGASTTGDGIGIQSQYKSILSIFNISSSSIVSSSNNSSSSTHQQREEESPSPSPRLPLSGVVGGLVVPSGAPCPVHGPPLLPPATNALLYVIASHTISIFGLLVLAFCVICTVLWDVACRVWYGMTSNYTPGRGEYGSLKTAGGLLRLFTGRYLHPNKCVTAFHWQEPVIVGTTLSFTVQCYQYNGRPYPISDADNVRVDITQANNKVSVVTEIGGCSDAQLNTVRCQFSSRVAGDYRIAVTASHVHFKGSPFTKSLAPGPLHPPNTTLVGHCSTVVSVCFQQHTLLLEPRDQYHNLCHFKHGQDNSEDFTLQIKDASATSDVECHSVVSYDVTSRRYPVHFLLQLPGCYTGIVRYRTDVIPNGTFGIIVLPEEDNERVRKYVQRRYLDGLEAHMLLSPPPPSPSAPSSSSTSSSLSSTKTKRVYCYITPKQLVLKEYILKIIPIRMSTFRLCPSTKLSFSTAVISHGPIVTIDDGCQPPVTLATKDRDVIAATFTQFMLKNIGGSETFKDKQDHFYLEVRKLHSKRPHERVSLFVSRDRLVESSMKATKNFSNSDWCKNFDINFINEEGLDWGGVCREWVEMLCIELFDNNNSGLFASFNEGSPQALVHPNPLRSSQWKMKHYQFAGRLVGKCLFESALGGKFHLTVRARFTRSFLAQIIGLRVQYSHFSQDDPELYSGQVQHLLDHGTDLLPEPLYFTDTIRTTGGEIKTVELETGGSSHTVTSANKLRYLDALAQHRLALRVHAEVQAFLEGLNEMVPDTLLYIFDENELELLMCGTERYSISDLKNNHVVTGGNHDFKRVLHWFWTAVANFTDEEMARLLQFTTGCSRLPPGGFAQLSPQFQIMPTHTYNILPTAHTCFNQLGLPDYDDYERFEQCLLIAIKEGSEGFGLV